MSDDEPRYHFRCPECEYTDKEAGALATKDQRWCGICASDGHSSYLIRWRADEDEDDQGPVDSGA